MFNIKQRFASLGTKFYQLVQPQPLVNPRLIHLNHSLAIALNLDDISELEWLNIVNGIKPIDTYSPLATLYAGHQFGGWVPQLGDGRAMLIAEHEDLTHNVWELQLKGLGQTPYSRFGDGRAVLRSSIREYLCSHAMQALGVPTTQALAIIGSDTPVYREEIENGAAVLRVAPSFIRFGHFEVFASRGQTDELKSLAQFVIDNYFPECNQAENKYSCLLDQVARLTAQLIAKWQSIGFCHGVMNSDNMSILGLTIDYGPFGFLDNYVPEHICNHSDSEGRYAYDNQPQIGWWNLTRLGESLTLLTDAESLQAPLTKYAEYFNHYYIAEMGNKLGISDYNSSDLPLLQELLNILAKDRTDWTIFWRNLSKITLDAPDSILDYVLNRNEVSTWLDKYIKRRQAQKIDFVTSQQLMLNSNPAIVLRNHLAQKVIDEAKQGNFSALNRLFSALSTPYAEYDLYADYYTYPPEWAQHLRVSCSS